ncbi:hypothetical protein D3C76_1428840 [compost metagenome]
MGDNVALSKVAIGAQLAFHVIVEGEIDIDGRIGRTVERSHYRLPGPAAGTRGAAVHHQLRLLVGAAHFIKQLSPGIFRGSKDH